MDLSPQPSLQANLHSLKRPLPLQMPSLTPPGLQLSILPKPIAGLRMHSACTLLTFIMS